MELILKVLSFGIVNVIGHYTKYGQDFLDKEAFTFIPDIRKVGIEDIDEEEFYELIGLTRQEKNQIKGSLSVVVSEDVFVPKTVMIKVKRQRTKVVLIKK
jgi:hypothetical protein